MDSGTKSKLNEAIAFAPMKKNSDKFKEHKAKVEENSEAVFKDSSCAIYFHHRIFSSDQRKLGFNMQIFLEIQIPKTTMKLKGFMVCMMNARNMRKKWKKTKKSLIRARKGYNSGRSIGISKLSVTE